jgi:bacterioferritin (cytochrome b1)
MITQVPREDINYVWEQVEPLIERALDDSYTARDVLDGIIRNSFQLFISWENDKVECAVVTEVADYPRKRILRYVLAGGDNLENWLEPIQEKIEEFATNNYCQAIEVAGRKGWLRKLKGFEQKIYIMSKEL